MTKPLIALVGAMLLVLAGCASQQERAERRAQLAQNVKEAVAQRRLHINVNSMNTLRYGPRMVTPDFYLELAGDTLRSYLPYLGQAYQAPMGTPAQGLNFEAPIERLQESRPKADMTRFVIDVKTQEDNYRYQIEVYDNGNANIHVQSQHRDAIWFEGEIDSPPTPPCEGGK